jgi:hypothetical protein
MDADAIRTARAILVREASGVTGVEIAPERESNAQARTVVQRRRLAGFYLDASIVSLGENANGMRAEVSVIVATYPGRDMRSILRGAATVPGGRGPEAERQALEGAIRGALRSLSQALAASAGSDL